MIGGLSETRVSTENVDQFGYPTYLKLFISLGFASILWNVFRFNFIKDEFFFTNADGMVPGSFGEIPLSSELRLSCPFLEFIEIVIIIVVFFRVGRDMFLDKQSCEKSWEKIYPLENDAISELFFIP